MHFGKLHCGSLPGHSLPEFCEAVALARVVLLTSFSEPISTARGMEASRKHGPAKTTAFLHETAFVTPTILTAPGSHDQDGRVEGGGASATISTKFRHSPQLTKDTISPTNFFERSVINQIDYGFRRIKMHGRSANVSNNATMKPLKIYPTEFRQTPNCSQS
jgi:hypothetical protein